MSRAEAFDATQPTGVACDVIGKVLPTQITLRLAVMLNLTSRIVIWGPESLSNHQRDVGSSGSMKLFRMLCSFMNTKS